MSIDNKCKFKWEDSIGEKVLDTCAKGLIGLGALSAVADAGYNTAMVFLDKMPNQDFNNAALIATFTSVGVAVTIDTINYGLSVCKKYK